MVRILALFGFAFVIASGLLTPERSPAQTRVYDVPDWATFYEVMIITTAHGSKTTTVPLPFFLPRDPYSTPLYAVDEDLGIYIFADPAVTGSQLQEAYNEVAWQVAQSSLFGRYDGSEDGPLGLLYTTNDLYLEITNTTVLNRTAGLVLHRPADVINRMYDLYFRTNLAIDHTISFSSNWHRIWRFEPGVTNAIITNLPPEQGFFIAGPTNNAIRAGMFTNVVLERNDDNHAGPYDIGPLTSNLLAEIGFPINFYGTYYTNLWVNNNGNVTFDSRFDHFAPDELVTFGVNIIAPFWADVDTPSPNSAQVTYGTNAVDGHNAFGVNWINVGYFGERADKLLIAQLVLINRSDIASGDFDMEFNYDKVEWEWGTASANDPPRAGFSNATNSFELPASGVTGAFLDSNPATGLIYNSLESPISGRYRFLFRSGQPL